MATTTSGTGERQRAGPGENPSALLEAFGDAGLGLALWNPEDRLAAFNSGFAGVLPEIADKVRIGTRFETLIRAAVGADAIASARPDPESWIAAALERHRAPQSAIEVETASGRWYRVSEARLADGATVSSWVDICELKSREAQLRRSEERYRHLVELTPALVLVHVDGRIVFCNAYGARHLGAETPEALHGEAVTALLDETAAPEQALAALNGETAPREVRLRAVDGSSLWVECHAAPFDYHQKTYVLVIAIDVTRWRNAEAEAMSAGERLATTLENVAEAVMLFDADDRLMLANRTGQELDAALGELASPGIPYAAMVRAGVAAGLYPQAVGNEAEWIAARLAAHRHPAGPVEIERRDGRWFRLNETWLADGSLVSVATELTERRASEEGTRFLDHHDSLTELPNRTLFLDRLEQAVAEASGDGTKVAVLFLDLDHFKNVNGTLGHAAGDSLLREVAERLRGCVRAGDTLARLGGDEFAVVQTRLTSAKQAVALAERMAAALAEPAIIDGQPLHTGASIGITLFPDDAASTADLLKNADLALYRAKGRGRGGAEFYSSEMGEQARQRMALAEGLRRALARDEFELYYQPKVRLADGAMVGGEALLRWHHPERGLITPGEFIGYAEASGLILGIGGWALDHTCAQLAAWARTGSLSVPIWVNVSPAQFHDLALIDKLRATLIASSVEPRMLGLEITETALMPDVDVSAGTLTSLVELGVELSIDDFGTGYSSLNYLKRFPVGKLKIDRSFVRDITTNPIDSAIARAIIHLGHSLGMRVLAEGVETRAQANLLSDLDCDEIQGLLVSPPLPADDFVDFMTRAAGREPHL